MTPLRLRILHLEDNSFDQELVRRTLLNNGVDCELVHARTKAEFEAALDREKFDLILSDFTIPGYDGSSALAFVRATCPDVPFVFVSGTIGEDRAIESLKNGAVDYVLKSNLERLPPAVHRALREASEHAMARAALEALRRSEERFREMAEHIGSVFYTIDLKTGRHVYVSPAYEQIWGLAAAGICERPAPWTASVVPEDRPAVLDAHARLSRCKDYCLEYRIRRPDGTQRWIEDRSYLIREADGKMQRAVGVATDITHRHQLEAQLRQAQKMEAVGQLAGGVAHDFNNVLTVVIGWARLLLDRDTTPPDAITPLTEIFNAGTRAANLTRQLLVFSNKQMIDRQTTDLNHVTGEISEMLRRLIGEHITLNLLRSPTPCLAEADAGMIEQVLMNLAVNARDAMPDGGTLSISTETVVIDNESARAHPDARPGAFACLEVSDTGCGIPREILQRIFEPFFTTKETGHGTGLGLAMVTGIVQRHQGWIELESTEGLGTRFRILLPAAQAADHASTTPARDLEPVGGSETILFVEDEPGVREFAVAVLNSHGYRVLQACSGRDALEVWQRHSSRITLLVTDLVMPDGISGVELAIRLRKEKPGLKVVLTSGYANDITGREFQPPANMYFIQKPYRPQALAQAVRTALDVNSAPPPAPVMKSAPALQLRHGASSSLDAHGAVDEIRRLIHQDQARLILFFCSANYDLAELAAELRTVFGAIPTIGCTAIGHVGTDGFTTGGITAISLAGDITAHPYAVDLADAEITVPNIGKETKRLIESLPDQHPFGLLLVDGLSLKEEQLTSLLYRHLPQIPVVGGSASGHQVSGPTHVYVDGAFRSHAAVFTLFQTRLPFRPIKFAHFESMENTLVVTRSAPSKRVIHELNGEPAAQVYADHLGVPVEKLDARTLSMHPFVLEMGGEQYLRAIASANPDQSLTLFCVIEDGVVLSIGRAMDPAKIAQAAFQRVRDEIGIPALVIGCDCISRRMEFEANGLLAAMGGIMKANQVFGFSTYGEQYDGLHMNQTFTGLAIGNDHVSS